MCLMVAACSALALAAVAWFGGAARQRRDPAAPRPSARTAAPVAYRPVYPYSVVPGGVFSREEAARAAAGDRVVAAHYAGFNLYRARAVRLERDWVAHVSFRIRNAIYWTRRPLRIRRGELVLTDGGSFIRARCGNRVAEKRQSPTTAGEPPAAVLDTPEPPVLAPQLNGMSFDWPGGLASGLSQAAPPITDVNRNLFDLIPVLPSSWGGGGLISEGSSATPAMPPAEPPPGEPAPDSPLPNPPPEAADWVRPVPPAPWPEPGPLPPLPPPDSDVIPVPLPITPGDRSRVSPVAPSGGGTPGVNPGDNPPPSPPPPPPLPPSTPPQYIVEPRSNPSEPPSPPAETPETSTAILAALALAVIAGQARRR